MTINIFVLKGDLNWKIVVVRFFFFVGYIIPSHFIIVPYFTLWMLVFFNTIRVSNSLDPDQA